MRLVGVANTTVKVLNPHVVGVLGLVWDGERLLETSDRLMPKVLRTPIAFGGRRDQARFVYNSSKCHLTRNPTSLLTWKR